MQYDIFISYRRLDSQGRVDGRDIARLLTKELKLYGYNVFFDYSEIKDNDFEQAILPVIRTCKVFILVLTKDALVRCKNSEDWVRREIMEAYKNGRKIITVNPGYTFASFPQDLPEELKFIKTVQMSSIDLESNFEITVEKMVRDRIQSIVSGNRLIGVNAESSEMVKIELNCKSIEIPEEFFNVEIYNALKKSYL